MIDRWTRVQRDLIEAKVEKNPTKKIQKSKGIKLWGIREPTKMTGIQREKDEIQPSL